MVGVTDAVRPPGPDPRLYRRRRRPAVWARQGCLSDSRPMTQTTPSATPPMRLKKLFIKTWVPDERLRRQRSDVTLAPHGLSRPGDRGRGPRRALPYARRAAEKVILRMVSWPRCAEAGISPSVAALQHAEPRNEIAHITQGGLVFGPQSYHRLPDLLARVASGESRSDRVFRRDSSTTASTADEATAARGLATLTVQEGCDKFCSVVSLYTRGASQPATAPGASTSTGAGCGRSCAG